MKDKIIEELKTFGISLLIEDKNEMFFINEIRNLENKIDGLQKQTLYISDSENRILDDKYLWHRDYMAYSNFNKAINRYKTVLYHSLLKNSHFNERDSVDYLSFEKNRIIVDILQKSLVTQQKGFINNFIIIPQEVFDILFPETKVVWVNDYLNSTNENLAGLKVFIGLDNIIVLGHSDNIKTYVEFDNDKFTFKPFFKKDSILIFNLKRK